MWGGGGAKIKPKDDGSAEKYFLWPVSLMADGTAQDGASTVRIRRREAVRGSNQDTFIERDTASSRADLNSNVPQTTIFEDAANFFDFRNTAVGNLTGWVGFAFIPICNYPKCILPYLPSSGGWPISNLLYFHIFQLLIQLH